MSRRSPGIRWRPSFDELIEIDPPWQPQNATAVEQTHFGRCFAEIIDWLESARGPFLLWCHLGGLGTAWDAPLRFRQAYCEEGDPPPPESADVPERMLPERLRSRRTARRHAIVCRPGDAVGYVPGSVSGFFLWAADQQRDVVDGYFGSRFSAGRARPGGAVRRCAVWRDGPRSLAAATARRRRRRRAKPALVEPADLWASLLDWWGIGEPPRSPTGESVLRLVRQQSGLLRDRLCVTGSRGQRAIRTPAWYLRAGLDPELYAKPDDRWEINNVASRCREVVEDLQDALTQYELALPDGRISELPPLGDVLLAGLE